MRWSEARARLAAALAGIGRQPHVAVPATLTALWLFAMPVYLASVYYTFALENPGLFMYDYSYFYFAVERFALNPLALYEDPAYLYPPPAVLAFLPARWASAPVGYVVLGPVLFASLGAAYAWALKLWEREAFRAGGRVGRGREQGERAAQQVRATQRVAPTEDSVPVQTPRQPGGLGTPTRVALLIIALGSGPTFQNLRYAQVNVLILLASLAFLHLVQRGKPGWGALALAGGFWVKLLPIVLLPLGLWRRWPRLAIGTLAGLVAVPLVLAPVVPLELYREYVTERLPAFSGATDLGPMSNSIQASLTRWAYPAEALIGSEVARASLFARIVGAGLGGAVIFVATLAAWTGKLGRVRAGFVVLAILPATIPLGWEHTFVLAIPLLLVALAEARRQRAAVRWIVGLAALAFFAQRLPPPQMAALVEALPRFVVELYVARLWLAVLALVGLVLAPAVWAGATKNAPPTTASGAKGRIREAR